MKIKVDARELADFVLEYLEVESLNQEVKRLRAEFDFNPFDEDGDAYVGAWAELRHNMELINDVVFGVIGVLERLVIGGQSLRAPEKLDAAVAALDKALALPWYAEMFDGPALKLLVSQAVALANLVGWKLVGETTTVQSKLEGVKSIDATSIFVKES